METPPSTQLVRARTAGPAYRANDTATDDRIGTLEGYAARFGEWTEIDSWYEGHFVERLLRGAFAKTIAERLQQIKVLFNHGYDSAVGRFVLGVPETLSEDDDGLWYEVPLLDTSYNRDLLPGLRAGAYGASFMFDVLADSWVEEPEPSEHNPRGLPERTINEVRLYELGPVTFPAYEGATAGARSLTHLYLPATPADTTSLAGPDRGAGDTNTKQPTPRHCGATPNHRAAALRNLDLTRSVFT